MKNVLISFILLILSIITFAQSPNLFKYQSVIRDGNGAILYNQEITLKISIISGRLSGDVVYSEIHHVTTNQYGLVNIEIGGGSVNSGTFSQINWGGNDYFINLAIDLQAGSNYKDVGTSQLVSVPYALYAESSGDSYLKKNNLGHLFFNDGRIGIGTDNPQKALHIRRVTDNGQGIGQAQLMIEADSESSSTIYLGYYPNSQYNAWESAFWRINSLKPNGDFSIGEETDHEPGGNGDINRLVIKRSTGNIGIGVEEPARKLHISDAIRLEPLGNAPSDPQMGDMYFGTDGKLHLFNGSNWYVVDMTLE